MNLNIHFGGWNSFSSVVFVRIGFLSVCGLLSRDLLNSLFAFSLRNAFSSV